MTAQVPVAVVGVTWQSTSTALRARLAGLPESDDPVAQLRAGGYLDGAVCLSTCSRTEWVLSSNQPEWAATLLASALLSRAPGLAPEQLHTRSGHAALHYLMRVCVGLDSVAEGEGAVGRQVLKAFEKARGAGLADKHLKQVWKHLELLIRHRRDAVPAANTRGVQALARDLLMERKATSVAVVGRGEFGHAMERALQSAPELKVTAFSRQTLPALMENVETYDAVVVCTGAAQPWLTLPERGTLGLVIDAGSPPQLKAAPGWMTAGLDELLSRPEAHLPETERERLEALVFESAQALKSSLETPTRAQALKAIDDERTVFLQQTLPALLEGLPRERVRQVKQAVGAFTHTLLKRTREEIS